MNSHAARPIVIGFDSSEGARHAIAIAAALFPAPGRHRPPRLEPDLRHLRLGRWRGGTADYDDDALRAAATEVAAAGCALAAEVGLDARPEIAEVTDEGAWHTILEAARGDDAELVGLARADSRRSSPSRSAPSRTASPQHADLPGGSCPGLPGGGATT